MSSIILKDELPRMISYPIGETLLVHELGAAIEAEDLGLYFLYTSGVQLNHYDPVTCKDGRYPVMALDRHPPQLNTDAEKRLAEERRSGRGFGADKLSGVARAQAQLLGGDIETESGEVWEPPPVCLSIFPVKTRLRRKVEDAIIDFALRPILNWLGASEQAAATQKALVLVFDETESKITTKFAEPSASRSRDRVYA